MTDTEKNEIIQRINTIEARILRLELLEQLNKSDWSKVPLNPHTTQGCSQEELMKPSYHCTHEHL